MGKSRIGPVEGVDVETGVWKVEVGCKPGVVGVIGLAYDNVVTAEDVTGKNVDTEDFQNTQGGEPVDSLLEPGEEGEKLEEVGDSDQGEH